MARLTSVSEVVLIFSIAAAPVISYLGWAASTDLVVMPHLYPPGAPRLSYGMKWGMLLVLIIVPLGMIGSLSVAMALRDRFVVAAGLALAGSTPAILFLIALWTDDVARYGYEPTKLVVYPVPALASTAIFVWGCVMAVAATTRGIAMRRRWMDSRSIPGGIQSSKGFRTDPEGRRVDWRCEAVDGDTVIVVIH